MRQPLCFFLGSCLGILLGLVHLKAHDFGSGGATKENLDLPADAVGGPDDDDEECCNVVEFYNQTLEAQAFFYVIDRSTTMQNHGELDRAKQEVCRNIDEFHSRVELGIFFFDKGLAQFPANGQSAAATPEVKASAKAFVQSTQGGTGTCGLAALGAALRMAQSSSLKRRLIIYLSDGGGTCPGNEEADYLEKTLSSVAAQNYQRVRINTIGVIDVGQLQESFLKRLAFMNGGTYTRI